VQEEETRAGEMAEKEGAAVPVLKDLSRWTVAKLRSELSMHGADTAGKKAELIARLQSLNTAFSTDDEVKVGNKRSKRAQPAKSKPSKKKRTRR